MWARSGMYRAIKITTSRRTLLSRVINDVEDSYIRRVFKWYFYPSLLSSGRILQSLSQGEGVMLVAESRKGKSKANAVLSEKALRQKRSKSNELMARICFAGITTVYSLVYCRYFFFRSALFCQQFFKSVHSVF